MNLLRRIERLESVQEKTIDAAVRIMTAEMRSSLTALTDEELDAMIAEDEKEPCDPEEQARLAEMTDEELCRIILE